jgi:hypothetical protein
MVIVSSADAGVIKAGAAKAAAANKQSGSRRFINVPP